MSAPKGDQERTSRFRRLRDVWRKRRGDDEAGELEPHEDQEQQRSEALGSSDRLRAEAPDDLETRRMADQVEREIKRSGGEP